MGKSLSDHIREMKERMDSEFAAAKLFNEIWTRHGEAEARRIFAGMCRSPTVKQLAESENLKLLFRYYQMEKPNVRELARTCAKENEALSREKQRGPGSTSAFALEQQIRRLIKTRRRLNSRRPKGGSHLFVEND
jgi:hypothetical protein